MAHFRPRSLRQLLGLLTLLLALPMLALALGVGVLQVRGAQQQLEAAARADARGVVHRVDQLVGEHFALLRQAAAATRDGDLPAVVSAIRAATGLHVALLDSTGAQRLDTRDTAEALPAAARAAAAALPREGRVLSTLAADPASGGYALLLAEFIEAGVLVLALPAAHFQAALDAAGEGRFNTSRFPSLVDAEGRIVARWRDGAAFIGRAMPDAARDALRAAPEGTWRGRSLAGLDVIVAHATSPLTGLAVGVGLTDAAMTAPFWNSALLLGPAVLGLMVMAIIASALVARHIAGPVASLGAAAEALVEGRTPPRLATPVIEVNAVAEAMADAADKRRLAEAQRDLLVRELHHRVKNLLATAQSLATLSARSTRDPVAFAAQFGDRLRALARTHTLLLEEPGGIVALRSLTETVLAAYRMGTGRIAISGADIRLPAEAALPIGMVLHELATNAAKYGSLSVPDGGLTVSWTLEQAATAPRLVIEWTERDGPGVAGPPTQQGFGSQLLRRALAGLPGGHVALDWREEGLAARLVLGIREVVRHEA